MKIYKILVLALLILPLSVFSQDKEDEKKEERPARPAFECTTLIDNQTNVVFNKNTLEVQIAHRFGQLDEENSLAGIWGVGNIRIGLAYSIHDRLAIGFGTTKNKRYQDFNLKAALLRQTRSEYIPISVTYYGNFAVSALRKENFRNIQDRYSFFNQIIIARRFSPKLSLQVAPSVSHFNVVSKGMKNDMFSVAFGGRYKISPQTSILFDYSQPLTSMDEELDPPAGFSLGVEFATSSHAFQIFATNNWGLLPQERYMFNRNGNGFNGTSGQWLLGFLITRNYNF